MSKNNKEFFKEKKIWSRVKDELLGCYLVPYFSKIMYTHKPLLYIDCFAGKGKFDDGEKGSPLNALECLERSLQGKIDIPEVSVKFIELNYAEELKNNIPNIEFCRYQVIKGAFEDNIIPLLNDQLRRYPSSNVFLYIDPYGIKSLNMSLFRRLPDHFSSAELLINLNSFGFLREALRVRKIALRENENDLIADLVEYDPSVLGTIEELNDIAGGDYWKEIVDAYKIGKIDMHEAEKIFADKYKKTLRTSYKYVLDLPIRLHQGTNPKYRMVYATNHADGCVLMADNIYKRHEYLAIDIQNHGQMTLFGSTPNSDYVNEETIDNYMRLLIEDIASKQFVRLNELQAEFFNRYGVICSAGELSSRRQGSSLKRFEKNGEIKVIRSGGTTSKYWTEGKGKTIMIRRA